MMKIGRWAAAAAGILVALLIAAAPASAASAKDVAKQVAVQKVAEEQALLGVGPTLQILQMQFCATAGQFPGGLNIVTDPQVHIGDCNNAVAHIFQNDPTAAISVLDDTVITVAAWQGCASAGVFGVGLTINSGPLVMYGDCNNANITID